MFTNAFIGATAPPTEEELRASLGKAGKLWDQLLERFERDSGTNGRQWGSSSKKMGWSLRVRRDDRIVVYLSPAKRCFLASFALGDKAIRAACTAKLPADVLKILTEAKRYAEGTAVRIEVRSAADADVVLKLARIKAEH